MTLQTRVPGSLALAAIAAGALRFGIGGVLVRHQIAARLLQAERYTL